VPATIVAAVDFGATSIRVCRIALGDGPPRIDVVHRHEHEPVAGSDGVLRWDWCRLVEEMERGLARATAPGDVASIGIDTWAVDYGLLDDRGRLIAAPVSYRDARTDGYGELVDRVGADVLYATTGLQLQPFNTIFQVAAHDRAELARARHLLLLPELLVHHLTGTIVAERTSAGCTGLLDITAGRWSAGLAEAAGITLDVLPAIEAIGTPVGTWHSVPVHLVGGHDTASAVAAMGASSQPGTAFASAGTWLLVGREQPHPDLSDVAREANFTNELGVDGGVRFLRNLAGAWLLERCRPGWGDPPVEALLAAAGALAPGPTIDVADPAFLHPEDMAGTISRSAGLPSDAAPDAIVRCIIDSLALGTAVVLDQLGEVSALQIFGGASQWELLRARIGEVSGVPVHTGPVEATALGNALVQGVALGVYEDLSHARRHLAEELG
jgi:rhamnulokinase